MSQKLISHNDDLKRLREDGYNIEIRSGFLLVKDVPYLNAKREVCRGVLVVKVVLAGDKTEPPDNHVAHFAGDYPCHKDGTQIGQIRSVSERQELVTGLTIDHTFSAKPKVPYPDYYVKVSTYCAILGGPAGTVDPSATAKTHAPVRPDEEDNSVFNYIDTASSRAGIDVVTQKLALAKIAIIGVGGTGAYVLDFVAKTPVREIHIFDKDVLLTHNAFRAPGAPSLEELRAKPRKVAYLAAIYSKMHRGIVPHDVHIDEANVELLRGMSFVFLCLDDGAAKKFIVQKLEEFDIAFVDVGMGIYKGDDGLGGTLRVTSSTPGRRDHVAERIPFAEGGDDNVYSDNIQIADLNALNATLAVIKWKKLCGFYMDYEQEHHSAYGIEIQLLTKKDLPHEAAEADAPVC